jgi:DNA recombination protein RmuC
LVALDNPCPILWQPGFLNEEIPMTWTLIAGTLAAGIIIGLMAALLLRLLQAKTAKELAAELANENETRRRDDLEAIVGAVKANFGSLSLDALAKSTDEFLKLAKSRFDAERALTANELEQKKGLIDQQLHHMTAELDKVSSLIKELEKDRAEKYGQLASQLKLATDQAAALTQTTAMLREALSSTKARGQWGERMADDVLRLAGFIENINYTRQKTIEGLGSRPDFTFLLPRDLRLNMDVKFPLDNYLRYLEASENDKPKFRGDFLRDVRAKIKEVTTREYISPEQNTVDSVLLFIPNEQIYGFIQEQDQSIVDESIKNQVVICSPLTLFAILAVIRKAVDNFTLEQTSHEILSLLGAFKKQWDEFLKKLDMLGKRLTDAQKEYEALITTRRRQLEKPLNRIEDIRMQRGLPVANDSLDAIPVRDTFEVEEVHDDR